jgi:hypothetical protein
MTSPKLRDLQMAAKEERRFMEATTRDGKSDTPMAPCPFCGGPAKFSIDAPNDECWIACESDSCDVCPSVAARTPKEAYARWNRRAPDAATNTGRKSFDELADAYKLSGHERACGDLQGVLRMSDTPRTDEAIRSGQFGPDYARQLEREQEQLLRKLDTSHRLVLQLKAELHAATNTGRKSGEDYWCSADIRCFTQCTACEIAELKNIVAELECGKHLPTPERYAHSSPEDTGRKSGEAAWMLENAMWRMFEHGKNKNTVSAQCEVQALGMFLKGEDIPSWHSPNAHSSPDHSSDASVMAPCDDFLDHQRDCRVCALFFSGVVWQKAHSSPDHYSAGREELAQSSTERIERENEQLRDAVTIWQKLADERKEQIDANFDNVKLAIAKRMSGHTIPAKWGEAWKTFQELLAQVKQAECDISFTEPEASAASSTSPEAKP